MSWVKRLLGKPSGPGRPASAGLEAARAALARSVADRPQVQELAADLQRLERENHITARIHAAMRGDRP